MTGASISLNTLYSPITCGVEGEFILFAKALKEGEDRVAAERANPGIIMYPHDEKFPPAFCRKYVIQRLRAYGVSINDVDTNGDPIPPEGKGTRAAASAHTYLEEYHRWSLKWEITVKLDGTEKKGGLDDLTRMLNLELVTPVLEDCPATGAEIERVFSLVQRFFRYHVNDTCGLHIHIGMGKNHLPDDALRRIAYMMWAADCWLTPLHLESRAHNRQCPRNRLHSNLAFGMTGEEANEIVGRGLKDSADKSDLEGARNGKRAVSIADGLREIRDCKTAAAVAKLMKIPRFETPGAYDFIYYLNGKRKEKGRPTIECRIGAGSMNPKWIASWARIMVRLCDYAVNTMDDATLEGLAIYGHDIETGVRPATDVSYSFLALLGLEEIVEFLKTTIPEERASRV